jgi:hypothetical protein
MLPAVESRLDYPPDLKRTAPAKGVSSWPPELGSVGEAKN